MRILLVGAGVVGMATGRGLIRLGHEVVFYDISPKKMDELRQQHYTTARGELFDFDVTFICTPETAVDDAVQMLALNSDYTDRMIVVRSTVRPGVIESLMRLAQRHICHNPEFLRESVADYEFMNPHFVVIGECCKTHGDILEDIYRPMRVPIIRVDIKTSQMLKLVSNAYLSTQISFWNEVLMISHKFGVNSHKMGKILSLDPRISKYGASMHGEPYGGKCLPKDLEQLLTLAKEVGLEPVLLKAVQQVNEGMNRGCKTIGSHKIIEGHCGC
jgi:UDPglucose 6-dehydrogenase